MPEKNTYERAVERSYFILRVGVPTGEHDLRSAITEWPIWFI